MKFVRNSRAVRAALLASAAGMSLSCASTAFAQDVAGPVIDRPTGGELTAQDDRPTIADTVRSAQDNGPDQTAPVSDILIANPGTPTTALDPNNVTGVGQMIVDEQNGFIGLCTGTLINPRTVIFAAHCVNERAANAYGENSGGQPIAFGFGSNNNAAGASAFGGYLSGATKYQTNIARNLYDVNYVAYNPLSTEPNAAGFLYGDVAMASLDTPAKGVPTWALLFSQLPAPATATAAGSGYHVTIEGYGNNGTGQTGAAPIDYRRRIAENMIGGLASLDEFENFLFGGNSTTNPQNLYWMDFDDPRRGTASASPYDFNAWRDNALPKEGITSQGDSGGPLILDNTYAKQLVIGVLSGGYDRFFNGQPANSYGTASFYQPLYLYWDWVAANNPYHYVSSVAGNGNWTDPTHWVTNLDPNYYVISGTSAVNGVPNSPGTGNTNTPGWGQACFQSGGVSDCYNVATGTETVTATPIGQATDEPALLTTGGLTDDKGSVSITTLDGQSNQVLSKENAELTAQGGGVTTLALPAATLANGLPGATNFVPNNDNGNRLTSTAPKYFDVTLAAAGTTTLSSAVTVDRFAMAGGNAMLDITAAGSLTSLMDVTQATGTMQVNGTLTTPEYLMITGGLNGTGTINAPFFTNMAGTIAPGTAGTTGTLTFRGNLILASASTYLVDLSNTGASDLIRVQATTFNGVNATNGIANIGGRLVVNFTDTLRAGQNWTVLSAQGGVTGTFQSTNAISAILSPRLTYFPTAVQLSIVAGSYRAVIDANSAVQANYASLLDQNRAVGAYDAIYGPLDLQNAATIRSTLEGLAPTTETTVRGLGTAMVDSTSGMIRDRLETLDPRSSGGTVARIGQPMRVASTALVDTSNLAAPRMLGGNEQATVEEGALPENLSAFIGGGYVDGDSAPMPAAIATGRDNFDGWYIAGGVEALLDDESAIGFAMSYAKMDSDGAVAAHSAAADLLQYTLYGKYQAASGFTLDTQMSFGLLDSRTRRTVSFVGNNYTLRADDNALAFTSEAGLGYKFDLGSIAVKPRVAWRTTFIDFSRTREYGGPVALNYDRKPVNSSQLRGGLTLSGSGMRVKPFVTGTYVHDFGDRPSLFSANFVGSISPGALFRLSSQDREWAEVGGGLTVNTGSVDLSVAGETTVWRDDVSSRSIRGSIGFHF